MMQCKGVQQGRQESLSQSWLLVVLQFIAACAIYVSITSRMFNMEYVIVDLEVTCDYADNKL